MGHIYTSQPMRSLDETIELVYSYWLSQLEAWANGSSSLCKKDTENKSLLLIIHGCAHFVSLTQLKQLKFNRETSEEYYSSKDRVQISIEGWREAWEVSLWKYIKCNMTCIVIKLFC